MLEIVTAGFAAMRHPIEGVCWALEARLLALLKDASSRCLVSFS